MASVSRGIRRTLVARAYKMGKTAAWACYRYDVRKEWRCRRALKRDASGRLHAVAE